MTAMTISSNRNISMATEDMDTLRLFHNIGAVTIAVCGILANITMTIAVLKANVRRHKSLLFILNLMLNNIIQCSTILPYIATQSFIIHDTSNIDMTTCRIMGYYTYSVTGSEIIGLTLVTINRYYAIVHYDIYQRFFNSKKNIAVLIAVSWIVFPAILVFPLTEVWGSFQYEPRRFFCHPFNTKDGFSKFFFAMAIIISVPFFLYCYAAILFQVWSTHKHINEQRQKSIKSKGKISKRRRRDIRLALTVLFIVLSFFCMYIPFGVFAVLDPRMEKYHSIIHITFLYIAWSHCLVHPLIYAIINSNVWKAMCLKSSHQQFNRQNRSTDMSSNDNYM